MDMNDVKTLGLVNIVRYGPQFRKVLKLNHDSHEDSRDPFVLVSPVPSSNGYVKIGHYTFLHYALWENMAINH